MNENFISFYNENGKDITTLIQEWINENSALWGCNFIPSNGNLNS